MPSCAPRSERVLVDIDDVISTVLDSNLNHLDMIVKILKANQPLVKRIILSSRLTPETTALTTAYYLALLSGPLLWVEAAKSGIDLPWDLLSCGDNLAFPMITMQSSVELGGTLLVPTDYIIYVILGTNCRFLDIAKANFSLAKSILMSGKMTPFTVNFEGAEELLSLVYDKGDTALIQETIRHGLDIEHTFLWAFSTGILGLVDLVADTYAIEE